MTGVGPLLEQSVGTSFENFWIRPPLTTTGPIEQENSPRPPLKCDYILMNNFILLLNFKLVKG